MLLDSFCCSNNVGLGILSFNLSSRGVWWRDPSLKAEAR